MISETPPKVKRPAYETQIVHSPKYDMPYNQRITLVVSLGGRVFASTEFVLFLTNYSAHRQMFDNVSKIQVKRYCHTMIDLKFCSDFCLNF